MPIVLQDIFKTIKEVRIVLFHLLQMQKASQTHDYIILQRNANESKKEFTRARQAKDTLI